MANRTELEQLAKTYLEGLPQMATEACDLLVTERFVPTGALPALPGDVSFKEFFDFLAKCHAYRYPKADHTADAVVFRVDLEANRLMTLLVHRGTPDEPYHGQWALPGGFMDMGESLQVTARRELEEETGIKVSYMEQLATFDGPDRDPRGRVISTAYLALTRATDIRSSDEGEVRWWPVKYLPPLAFDHDDIMQVALQRLRTKVQWQPIGIDLLPEFFSLRELRQVYEVVLCKSLDPSNFRRKLLKYGCLVQDSQGWRFDRDAYEQLRENGTDFEV